ncbi:hypothetical protein TraAM80_00744 [Trypanosoma rangeli]|uniref:EF-hand domain-containing protein n=1 Tax=Trypanosoma rangeli TaxID=5698 RepID=A0A3S5ISK1_TRYRA|nr:uncharacterized protein TraAM80_00744 [Trypanosoma rangeli]RNF11761.1 hypothetical protein TraAM80_00744 [Trypanosoma rangeli]|eukprot:RNF11761.1 hypothetical protein TraAM80_00744 [Trypanosoma rangeli]
MQQLNSASSSSSTFTNNSTVAALGALGGVMVEPHQELSHFLVATSVRVRVRGLPEAIADTPLIVELVVDSSLLLADRLLPVLADAEDAPQRNETPPVDSHCLPSTRRTLGLDHLRIVVPVVSAWRPGAPCEAVDRRVSLSDSDAASTTRGCVHVVLRTVHGAVVVGGASCHYPGDREPVAPCGGDVQVEFKVYCQGDGGVARSPGSGQRFLDGPAECVGSVSLHGAELSDHASVATDNGTSACTPMVRAVADVRQVHSAGGTPKRRSRCGKSKQQPLDLASGVPGGAEKTCPSSDSSEFNYSAPSVTETLHPVLSHVFLVEDASVIKHAPASCGTQSGKGVRTRECQPRSLVFSHIQVSGFNPLSSHGSWRLEFTWPQHKVSPVRRTVRIPTSVDENGAVAVQETICIDLPLFMRREVQTCMHAVWSGTGDNDTKMRLYLQVEFDPLLAVVQDQEMRWEKCRRHALMLIEGLPLTMMNLCVRLVMQLEFYEPQRDGQNGRPTSALPRHRGDMAAAAAVGESDNEEEEAEERQEELERAAPGSAAKLAVPAASSTPPAVYGPAASSANAAGYAVCQPARPTGAGHGTPGGGGPGASAEIEAHAEPFVPLQRQEHPAQWGGTRSLSPQYSTAEAPSFPNVQGLVPCYSDEQREVVFRAYDTDNCGRMTLKQLLHFCRAHVALFDGEENDASILRGLRPYVPCVAHRYHSGTNYSFPSWLTFHVLPAAASPEVRGTVTPSAHSHDASTPPLTGLAGCESEGIGYNVFEIIALRLASM